MPQLYRGIVIPSMVCEELSRSGAPAIVRQWIAKPPTWLDIRIPILQPDAGLIAADLDEGERDAILLAQELDADELIIDDMAG